MIVFVFPPKLSCKSLVSLESRYGIWVSLPDINALITFPRADKERFILEAYLSLSPLDPLLDCLSDPAKSTKLNLDPLNRYWFSFISED